MAKKEKGGGEGRKVFCKLDGERQRIGERGPPTYVQQQPAFGKRKSEACPAAIRGRRREIRKLETNALEEEAMMRGCLFVCSP